ncbi:MAG TPA: 5-oxoprolinase subunit PxpB [Mycobacteriales bacterium]|nr:5-oxoprolinase subunit PxpB [Mycobacteriales bacterium]
MRLRPAGEHAVLVELEDLEAAHGLAAAVRDARLPGVVDVVPGYVTLLVVVDEPVHLSAVRNALPGLRPPAGGAPAGKTVEVPVVYDGEDLPEVCRLTGLSREQVVRRHAAPDYVVAFLGFIPGFPYLVGLDQALHVPRRPTPRTAVPAGSVGLAGSQTGVYPRTTPGGWQLLGHTDVVLFDPHREPPALLAPGDRLRFVDAS